MRLNLVLDDPRYRLHRDVVASLASGLERKVASALGARWLLRASCRVRAAAARCSPQCIQSIEVVLTSVGAPSASTDASEAVNLESWIDSDVENSLDKVVVLLFLQATVDFEGRLREQLESDALAFAANLPFNLIDLLEDDGELEPSVVRQLADAEVARQCRDLEEAIDGRVVARDESVVEL